MLKPLLIAVVAAAAAPAGAQVTRLESAIAAPKGDYNRIVCEREETTGSRLGARRVCLTVLQWEEKRREHRESTEKVQRTVNQAPSGG
jgi:hypothetical protein